MEFFEKAQVVRLRSHHEKYLLAEDDQEGVCQDRNGTVRNARWTVEIVDRTVNVLRFQSCYGKYLTASNMPMFLGMTGKKVLQTLPRRLDSSLEWEPIREGVQVKLKTRYGLYLRANGGVPPWRNSITHDIPHRTSTQDWILWDIDVIQLRVQAPSRSPPPPPPPETIDKIEDLAPEPIKIEKAASEPESDPPTSISLRSPRVEGDSFHTASPVKAEGRIINFEVIDEDGNVDEMRGSLSFTFKGSGVEQLKESLRDEVEIEDFFVCCRNPLNGKLYPLRLHLPPNNASMHVVVVPSTSKAAEEIK